MLYEDETVNQQKIIVATIVGMLIGGLLVRVFSSPVPVEEGSIVNKSEQRSVNGKAVSACITKGGVPILAENYERLIDCLGL